MTLRDSLQGRCSTSLPIRICVVYASPAAQPAQTETTSKWRASNPTLVEPTGCERSLFPAEDCTSKTKRYGISFGLRARLRTTRSQEDRPGSSPNDTIIEAKTEGNPSLRQMEGHILKAVLKDRFKLKAHRQRKSYPFMHWLRLKVVSD
jgi:hypothetical protein